MRKLNVLELIFLDGAPQASQRKMPTGDAVDKNAFRLCFSSSRKKQMDQPFDLLLGRKTLRGPPVFYAG
jgi:hypothetical protein